MNKQAEKVYRDFLGREAASETEIELGEFKELAQIGKVSAIEYTARKHSDNKQYVYRHKFKKKPMMLTNGTVLIIIGDYKITERGIEG